jgi:transposase
MGGPKRAEYQQLLLLPRHVEEWVGPEHVARFVRDFVDALDLTGLGFEVGGPATGCPGYADELLLKVWLYGYLEKVRATRPLERACRERLGLIWLTGDQAPDHNTLWRFWQRHRASIRQVFRRVVQVAVAADLVGVVLHAVDGTKLAARASRRGVRTRAQVQALLAELDGAVDEVIAQVEAAEASPGGRAELPPEWRDLGHRREQLRELLGQLEAAERERGHAGEPTAALLPLADGPKVPAYNAQVVVDQQSGLVVAAAVPAEPTDTYQLVPMVEAAAATVGTAAAQTVADAGYHSSHGLAVAAAAGYGVVVAESPQRAPRPGTPGTEYHAARFTHDAARNVCVCPRGAELPFARWRGGRGHRAAVRVYRCAVFRQCPVRAQCSRDPRGRAIEIGAHHAAVGAQRAVRAAQGAVLRQRSAIVERIFAVIKELMGFRRWTVAGLDNVRAQWDWVCTAYNLRVLYGHWRTGRLRLAA